MFVKPDSESDFTQNSEQQVDQHHSDAGRDARRQRECEQKQLAVAQPPFGGEHPLHRRTAPLRTFGRRNVGHRRADRRFAAMWQEQSDELLRQKGRATGQQVDPRLTFR